MALQKLSNNRIRAVIFDFDGVIVDSKKSIFETYKEVCKEMGIKFYSSLREFLKNNDGNYLHFYVRLGIKKKDFAKIGRLYRKHYKKFENHVFLFDGIKETFKALKKFGFKIGVCSNTRSYVVNYFLRKFGLKKYTDVVVCGNDVKRLKPNPLMIIRAAKEMGVKLKETAFVGDMEADMIAGKRAKVAKLIAVTYGYHPKRRLEKFDPDSFASNPKQILNIVLSDGNEVKLTATSGITDNICDLTRSASVVYFNLENGTR